MTLSLGERWAPNCNSSSATSRWPNLAATISAVNPDCLQHNRHRCREWCFWGGVLGGCVDISPWGTLSAKARSAPRCSNNLTMSALPRQAVMIRAVDPFCDKRTALTKPLDSMLRQNYYVLTLFSTKTKIHSAPHDRQTRMTKAFFVWMYTPSRV